MKELIQSVIALIKNRLNAGSTAMNPRWCRAIIAGWNPPASICEQDPYNPAPYPFPLPSWQLEEVLAGMPVKKIREIADAVSAHDYGEAQKAEHDLLADYCRSVLSEVEGARDLVLPVGHELAGMVAHNGGWVPHRNFFSTLSLPLHMLREVAAEYGKAYPQTLIKPPVKEIHLPEAKDAHEARPYGFWGHLKNPEAKETQKEIVEKALNAIDPQGWQCTQTFPRRAGGFIAHVLPAGGISSEIKVTV